MRFVAALALASLVPAWAQIAKPQPLTASANAAPVVSPQKTARVPMQAIRELERTFNGRLRATVVTDQPLDLVGDTRGVQLDNYGIVFTTEVSLGVVNLFGQTISKELSDRVHKMRVDRMPVLKTAMKEMMRNMAAACTQIPNDQQLVLAVRLYYGSWEDTTGMPAQIIMKADRASAAKGILEMEER